MPPIRHIPDIWTILSTCCRCKYQNASRAGSKNSSYLYTHFLIAIHQLLGENYLRFFQIYDGNFARGFFHDASSLEAGHFYTDCFNNKCLTVIHGLQSRLNDFFLTSLGFTFRFVQVKIKTTRFFILRHH